MAFHRPGARPASAPAGRGKISWHRRPLPVTERGKRRPVSCRADDRREDGDGGAAISAVSTRPRRERHDAEGRDADPALAPASPGGAATLAFAGPVAAQQYPCPANPAWYTRPSL